MVIFLCPPNSNYRDLREVKPKTQIELREGILRFWRTVTVSKCRRYINYLRKVIPRMIEVGGEATGY